MKFGMLYELQLPKPWDEEAELRLIEEATEQIVLADQIGVDHAWAVEHHFLEEYSIVRRQMSFSLHWLPRPNASELDLVSDK